MPTPSQRTRREGGGACRAGLRRGGWGGGGGEGWGKGLALERRRREWAQLGENRGTRAGACTDISPTSLHNEERREVSARAVVIANSRDLVGLRCADPRVTQWGALSSGLANQDHGGSERRRSHVDSNRTLPQHSAGPS